MKTIKESDLIKEMMQLGKSIQRGKACYEYTPAQEEALRNRKRLGIGYRSFTRWFEKKFGRHLSADAVSGFERRNNI